MTQTLAVAELSFKRALNQIASKYAFFYDTMVAFAFPAILVNVVNDTTNSIGNILNWFLVSTTGWFAAALVLFIARFICLPRGWHNAWIVIPIFAVAGLARGLAIYNLGGLFGVVSPIDATYRILGSTVFSIFGLGLVTVLTSNAVRSSRKVDDLEHRMAGLQDALINLREKLAVQKAELAGQVKALVYPMVEDLISKVSNSKNSAEISDSVLSLKTAIDQGIRPLSLSIAADQSSSVFELSGKAKTKFRLFAQVSEPIEVSTMFSPLWMPLFLMLVAGSAATHIFGVRDGLVQVVIAGSGVFAGQLLLKALIGKWKIRQEGTFVVIVSSYLLIGFITDFVIALNQFNEVGYQVGRLTALVTIVGLGFFVGGLYQLQRGQAETALLATNEHLERLNAAARRELWLYRRKVATVLHGSVQAHLYASAIRLAQTKRITKQIIERETKELRATLSELDFEQQKREPLRSVIRQIIDVWAGTCEIYSQIDKSIFILAKKDAEFEAAFIEVVREAISNAVKHSKATEIEMQAEVRHNTAYLTITSNRAQESSESTSSGFGTKLFNELTLRWGLSTEAGQTKFEAEIVGG